MLDDLVGGPDRLAAGVEALRGRIAVPPANLQSGLTVIVPAYSEDHDYEVPAGQWMPRSGTAMPSAGDWCVVVIDSDGDAWVPVIEGVSEFGAVGTAQVEEWLSGTVAPATALGKVGDWYLNTATGDIYEKTAAAVWTSRGSIRGPQGVAGAPGAQGLPGATGPQGPQGPQGATGGNATVPLDTWHRVGSPGEPTFQGAWRQLDAVGGRDVAFTKDPLGRVMLTGVITAGVSGTLAFTLPVGYRPRKSFQEPLMAGPSANPGQVSVDTNGGVYPANVVRESNVTISDVSSFAFLDGVIFDTGTVSAMPSGPAGPTGSQGPTGPAGTTGPAGGVEVYEQPAQPVSTAVGAVWIDTDENAAGVTVYDSDQIGTVKSYAGSTIPTNWLLADGRPLSRIGYPELFSAIGVTYGAGDGSTTFNLPDLRSRMIVGAGPGSAQAPALAAGLTARTVNGKGGEESHKLITAEMPSHTHSPARQAGNAGADRFALSANIVGGQTGTNVWGVDGISFSGAAGMTATGGDGVHENMPPWCAVAYIVKVTGSQINSGGVLVGPQGPTGATGATGPAGSTLTSRTLGVQGPWDGSRDRNFTIPAGNYMFFGIASAYRPGTAGVLGVDFYLGGNLAAQAYNFANIAANHMTVFTSAYSFNWGGGACMVQIRNGSAVGASTASDANDGATMLLIPGANIA